MCATTAMVWTDCYSIGLADVDLTKKDVVYSFNSLVHTLNAPSKTDISRNKIKIFSSSMASVFMQEEHYMTYFEYQDHLLHKERHNNYLKRLCILSGKIAAGDQVVDQVLSFFCGWLTHHVSVTDQLFAIFLREHRNR